MQFDRNQKLGYRCFTAQTWYTLNPVTCFELMLRVKSLNIHLKYLLYILCISCIELLMLPNYFPMPFKFSVSGFNCRAFYLCNGMAMDSVLASDNGGLIFV